MKLSQATDGIGCGSKGLRRRFFPSHLAVGKVDVQGVLPKTLLQPVAVGLQSRCDEVILGRNEAGKPTAHSLFLSWPSVGSSFPPLVTLEQVDAALTKVLLGLRLGHRAISVLHPGRR
jgi:hypothetical protein